VTESSLEDGSVFNMSLLQNSKNTLRPFDKLSAQGERYLNGILIVPFVVSLSNHLSRLW